MQLTQIWHYARPDLADFYLQTLSAGLVVSTTIFAPRRTGKTTFLRKDLTPAAERVGFCVVYADLWQTRQNPALALLHALEQASKPTTMVQKIAAQITTPVKSLKAGAEIPGARVSGEITLDNDAGTQPEVALQIASLLKKLCKKKPVLLMVDEAQELARSRSNELLATALRTAITLNQDRVRVIFTGSSRTRLASVFSNARAPLYSTGAAINDFPMLDKQFIAYVPEQYQRACGRKLNGAAAWRAFRELNYLQEPFLKSVMSMVLSPGLKLDEAMGRIHQEQERSENHDGVWSQLDAVQKAVTAMLAADPRSKPFSRLSIITLRKKIGVNSLQPTHVQRALANLADANIVVKTPQGHYEFENSAFLNWVRTLAPQD